MKKINKRGFAFSELLMVTVVIIGVFMIIYTNIFPIMGELEKRKEYSDLSANYIAFYLRKALINVELSSLLDTLNYVSLYAIDIDSEGNEVININPILSKYSNFLSEANVEKVILTNDVITNLKSDSSLSDLSDYIDYLPVYNNLNDGIEQYRLIIKTETGYATTLVKFLPGDYAEIFEFDGTGTIIKEVKETGLETLSIPDFVNGISTNAFNLESLTNLKSVYMNCLKNDGTSNYVTVNNFSFVGTRKEDNKLKLYIRDCTVGSENDVKSGLNISNESVDLICMQSDVGGTGEDE